MRPARSGSLPLNVALAFVIPDPSPDARLRGESARRRLLWFINRGGFRRYVGREPGAQHRIGNVALEARVSCSEVGGGELRGPATARGPWICALQIAAGKSRPDIWVSPSADATAIVA